ncbi:MAG TPA: hypothetical protein DCZ92_04810 [Elusimicrobia bacterium]|nr:MAG: hypothetical protein A2016_03550 [Elusimicrobia bacterium GWF2_62_30]HBA60129.1 hypothetical protein [Elusimicrobiota bacterium]
MKKTLVVLTAAFFSIFQNNALRAETGLEQLESSAQGVEISVPKAAFAGGGSSEAGIPGSFVKAADKAFRGNANYITLYAMPSPHAMDWKNLATLVFSFARNQAAVSLTKQTHAIGHVAFEIGCTLPDGRRTLVVSGQVPKDKDSMGGFTEQAKAGAGYSAFFGYVPGRLQTQEQLETELDTLSNEANEVAFLTLKVSPQSCLEAQRYIKAYDDEGVSTRYGLGVRPLYKEGGGCANVGVSVVEVAGPADFERLSSPWGRTFYVPQELLGDAQNNVGLGDVASYWKYDWTKKPAGEHKKLFFYDPDLIYKWIRAAGAGSERYMVNKSAGLTLDYTSSSSPTQWWRTDN